MMQAEVTVWVTPAHLIRFPRAKVVFMNTPTSLSHLSILAGLFLLAGCSETEPAPGTNDTGSAEDAAIDTGSGAMADTGSEGSGSGADTSDTQADTTVEPACTALAAGNWNVNGSCIGMMMSGEMTVDATGCSFTLGGWNMAMDVPAGGTVAGDTVTFTGRNWTGCTGTVAATGMRVDASCPAASGSPACSFTMVAR